MIIKGFEVLDIKSKEGLDSVLVKDVCDLSPYGFDVKGTFESGQCFRWDKISDDRYFGIAHGRAVYVSLSENKDLLIENSNLEDFKNIWYEYFDLGTDYRDIIDFVDKDEFMHQSVIHSGGARMLVQEFEETLFSYIISAQNNIPRIKKLVKELSQNFGDPIYSSAENDNGEILGYSFPSAQKLSESFCTIQGRICKANSLCDKPFAGYRCPYIKKTAQMINSLEYVPDFDFLAKTSAANARKDLCKLAGVGEKVADCTLLYSGIRKDICPIDTWVEKTIKTNYLTSDSSKAKIREFTENYFGEYAGYAQLWFFNYSRNII